jgi:hypothetical protein
MHKLPIWASAAFSLPASEAPGSALSNAGRVAQFARQLRSQLLSEISRLIRAVSPIFQPPVPLLLCARQSLRLLATTSNGCAPTRAIYCG